MNRFVSDNSNNIQCFLNRWGKPLFYQFSDIFINIFICFPKLIAESVYCKP